MVRREGDRIQGLPRSCPFQTDLEDMTDLTELREEMSNLVLGAVKEAEEYQDSFERYSYLWADDPQEVMKNFLTFGRAVSPEDLDTRAEETLPKRPPTLAQFQQQVHVNPPPPPPMEGPWASCKTGLNFFEMWVFLLFKYREPNRAGDGHLGRRARLLRGGGPAGPAGPHRGAPVSPGGGGGRRRSPAEHLPWDLQGLGSGWAGVCCLRDWEVCGPPQVVRALAWSKEGQGDSGLECESLGAEVGCGL